MPVRPNPLLKVLRDPGVAREFSVDDWNLMLRQAKRLRLVSRLGFLIEDQGLADDCPRRFRETTLAARSAVHFQQVQIGREARRVAQALDGLDTPLVLLKGAAYLEAGLPHSRGRHMSDIDVLVPEERIPDVEERLLNQGWEPQKLDAYDQRYYREWMHEIPPLRHPEHGIEIDVHHALLPLTARVRPNPRLLRERSRPIGKGPYRVLSPVDMVLHGAAHLFYDGEIAGALRDLIDLHQMLGHFGAESDFWTELPARAERLELHRPLFYSLHFCELLLGTGIPPETLARVREQGAPPKPVGRLMDLLVPPVLRPRLPGEGGAPVAAWLLFVRSHWLRMPPWLLARHLNRKAWRRMKRSRVAPA